MVLKMLGAAYGYFPTEYTVHVAGALIALLATHRIAQGRKTTRERDMHARVVVVTGGFTPLGLTLLESIAARGAHIIALTPLPVADPRVATYIDLLRSTTQNEEIYAEECDLSDPASVHAFAKRFVLGNTGGAPSTPAGTATAGPSAAGGPQRLDALVFAHEYAGVGALPLFASGSPAQRELEQRTRDTAALASFLLTTLLLPAMLTAPADRDLRIVHVINRWYAAAGPRFFLDNLYSFGKQTTPTSPLLPEASRALRTALFTRHLQRILDALPAPSAVPDPSGAVPAQKKSNIVAVSVSPGLSRVESVGPLFGVGVGGGGNWLGAIFYVLLYPILLLLTKSAAASVQSVLHVLFVPTVGKLSKTPKTSADAKEDEEEALLPGALYAECAVVRTPAIAPPLTTTTPPNSTSNAGTEKTVKQEDGDEVETEDERAGRMVWEAYEAGLRAWEAANPSVPAKAQADEGADTSS
ncbi:hypothetical protein B0H14DRAFT_2760101 [Mycena olivaceomarginata]|nr:hypothetical protein B0H14DRAFT_2760101 [Mycena olivaceomarginata]